MFAKKIKQYLDKEITLYDLHEFFKPIDREKIVDYFVDKKEMSLYDSCVVMQILKKPPIKGKIEYTSENEVLRKAI